LDAAVTRYVDRRILYREREISNWFFNGPVRQLKLTRSVPCGSGFHDLQENKWK
jgi:hypothetical protein